MSFLSFWNKSTGVVYVEVWLTGLQVDTTFYLFICLFIYFILFYFVIYLFILSFGLHLFINAFIY